MDEFGYGDPTRGPSAQSSSGRNRPRPAPPSSSDPSAAPQRGAGNANRRRDVSEADKGKLVARPHTCAHDGGRFLACVLVADTLTSLRARMPAGISRRGELAFSVPDMIELWD